MIVLRTTIALRPFLERFENLSWGVGVYCIRAEVYVGNTGGGWRIRKRTISGSFRPMQTAHCLRWGSSRGVEERQSVCATCSKRNSVPFLTSSVPVPPPPPSPPYLRCHLCSPGTSFQEFPFGRRAGPEHGLSHGSVVFSKGRVPFQPLHHPRG